MSVGNGWGYPSPLRTSIHKMSSKTAFWPAWQILILTYVLSELSAVTEDRLFSGLHTRRPPSEGFTCSLRYSFKHRASRNIYIWNKFDNDLGWNLFLPLKTFSPCGQTPKPREAKAGPSNSPKNPYKEQTQHPGGTRAYFTATTCWNQAACSSSNLRVPNTRGHKPWLLSFLQPAQAFQLGKPQSQGRVRLAVLGCYAGSPWHCSELWHCFMWCWDKPSLLLKGKTKQTFYIKGWWIKTVAFPPSISIYNQKTTVKPKRGCSPSHTPQDWISTCADHKAEEMTRTSP